MDKMRIRGGRALSGRVEVSGSKNAALPILFSTLLTGRPCHLTKVPNLQDIRTTLKLLAHLGVKVESHLENNSVTLNSEEITSLEAPYDLVRKMRASVVVLGPLLARFGQAKVSLPGGCAIGARPINYHLLGLEKLGAQIELENGYVKATARQLIGNRVAFEFPSVGATENLMMAAVLAKGETLLENCAQEPEIVDLARALRSMGAKISGEGTENIYIQGVTDLQGAHHEIMGDRIEAGTFLAAGFATRGEVEVYGIEPVTLESVLVRFEEAGAHITRHANAIHLKSRGRPQATDITTLPFPGFPTDMQAQFMSVMAVADGTSLISETIFENRFMHVPELQRLGAQITIKGNTAIVKGQEVLQGAQVMATDLRASASLILGGLCAQGETVVNRIYHLDRGYERVEEKFRGLGADIERIQESEN
jgi:UDP-N-acetylglucosamine 1-carboxyvinyltransferase